MLRPKNLNVWSFFFLIGLVAIILIFLFVNEKVMAEGFFSKPENNANLPIFGETSFLPIVPTDPDKSADIVRTVEVIVTAYSSTVWETDEFPFITASGEEVRDGIVANNMLPFGTKIRLPELFGDKVFIVKDRMNSRKSDYHVDIWQASHQEAKEFGAKYAEMEILAN